MNKKKINKNMVIDGSLPPPTPPASQEQSEEIEAESPPIIKRKRRTKKSCMEDKKVNENTNITNTTNTTNTIVAESSTPEEDPDNTIEAKIYKKRGRKPKGGKIIINQPPVINIPINTHNIILHLKCTENDLKKSNNSSILTNAISYHPTIHTVENYQNDKYSIYETVNNNTEINNNNLIFVNDTTTDATINHHINDYNIINNSHVRTNDKCNANSQMIKHHKNNDNINNNDINTPLSDKENSKILWEKINNLIINLHNNTLIDKKSDCFWCTYNFDNPPIYIPKYELNGKYYCYGCFCSPECATSYLFKESIDTSTRFERYHLLNYIYCQIYNYKKNIKPAPDPYYTLNKYYGDLSIQEYRLLLKNERLLIVIDKPLTHVLPEIHEDNDELSYSSKSVIYSNKFNLKKSKKQTKSDIIYENFNMKI